MSDQIMTTEQVAEMLQVSEPTMKRWRSEGEGPPWFTLSSGPRAQVRYSRLAIDAWIEDEHKRAFQERHERKDGGMG